MTNASQQALRNAARKFLPGPIRQRLGALAGKFNMYVIQALEGLIFDLRGGRFQADGCTFIIPKDVTTRQYRACFLRDTYEREERELICRWVRPEDRVIELGACLGVVSCVTNKILADKSRHVVVEANPFCIAPLYRNKELNQSGFLIEHCAVGSEPEATFYLHPVYIVGGSSQRATNRPFRLPAKSLRQLERERGPFTALIIDVEGSEREVFEDSKDLLKQYRLVIAELHEYAIGVDGVERCRRTLRDSGLLLVGQAGITEAWERS
jgi:FkbM family methyltransferase